mgnify:CR=1 FL=1
MRKVFVSLLVILLYPQSVTAEPFSPHVDDAGNISLPQDFRANMTHLGSWFVPAGEASGFHDVYANRSGVDVYRSSGAFPDGTVLVKELRAHTSGSYTTGSNVSFANDTLKQWFVMIKDSNERFAGNGSWGNGWGWALFQPGKQGNQSKDYKTDCLGCHVPAQATDWVYTQAYPTLQRSR